MSNVLTTKEEVKIWLEDTAGTNSFDALLDGLIRAVSQRIETAANRKLFSATYIELHNGGAVKIFVKNPPITSITSIVHAPDYDFANGMTLSASEYVLDPSDRRNAIFCRYGEFPAGEESLKVTYVGGYTGADVVGSTLPDLLKNAATQQVVFMFKNRKTIGLDGTQVGDGLIQKVSQRWFVPEVHDVIKQLRVRNIY
jgi:hypothetical protein